MDGQQFDQLARVIASGTSRRRVLGMIAAGVASLGTHFTTRIAEAGCQQFGGNCNDAVCCEGLVCLNDSCGFECAEIGELCGLINSGQTPPEVFCCTGFCNESGICEDFVPVCSDEGGSCSGGKGPDCCIDGLECVDGICVVPDVECPGYAQYCGPKSAECCADGLVCISEICQNPPCGEYGDTEYECCEGFICVDGMCDVPEPICLVEGDACEVDDDCCEGICCAGFCRAIECCIDEPNPNDRCPEGTSCFEGICEGVTELCADDSTCGTGTCCCDDGSCSEECCDPPVDDDDEPVTQLPNTGSGATEARISSWIGATAIGAAAAAYLGGKRIRPANPSSDDYSIE